MLWRAGGCNGGDGSVMVVARPNLVPYRSLETPHPAHPMSARVLDCRDKGNEAVLEHVQLAEGADVVRLADDALAVCRVDARNRQRPAMSGRGGQDERLVERAGLRNARKKCRTTKMTAIDASSTCGKNAADARATMLLLLRPMLATQLE